MSDAEPGDLVTSSSDGVTIEKSFEPDDFPVPAIAFVIRSSRNEPVSVRMSDTVPDHVSPEDIGFHPKYGAEFWGVEGDMIVFEREFEPGEEYTTVYGLRGGDAQEASKYMTEPTLESIAPAGEGDSGQLVRDVIGGNDSDPPSGGSVDDIENAIEAIDTEPDPQPEPGADGSDDPAGPAGGVAVGGPANPTPTADGRADGPAPELDSGSLVAALAGEIRAGEVDETDVDALRDALGVDSAGGSVDARIEHLQSELADLQAYTAALEEFLDENGDAQTLIEDLRAELETTTERLDGVESTAREAAETAESADDRIEESLAEAEERLESELEEAEERLESELEEAEVRLESELDSFEARADDIETRVEAALDDVEVELEGLEDVVEDRIDAELDELWTSVDEAAADAADVADELDALRTDLEDLEDAFEEDTSERLDRIETEMGDIETELEDLAEMRDRLASALGGFAAGDQ